jgi:hypothetical protein
VEGLAAQAQRLIQDGDEQASGAMAAALHNQSLRLLAQVSAYLRQLTAALGANGPVDGLLLLARLACHVRNNLVPAMQKGEGAGEGKGRRHNRQGPSVDLVQMESVFSISDTREQGELSQSVWAT